MGAVIAVICAGCASTAANIPALYPEPEAEAEWIREGAPIQFKGELWYPVDTIEILTDQDVYPVDEYRGVAFFVEKVDVQPYRRLFTKFGYNQFRPFERKANHD